MIKKLCFLFILIIAITALIGCGSTPKNNNTNEKITQLTEAFKSAVENYDVNGMLECLSGGDFTLTIEEAGQSDTKAYDTLVTEIENDETNQLDWRKPVSEGGHAYVLELVLDASNFDNVTSTGGFITRNFEVLESADGTSEIKTDNGVITWEVAQSGGIWKATAMTIEYQALTAAGLSWARVMNIPRGGFGFTTLNFPL